MLINISMKFHEDILNGFQVTVRTSLIINCRQIVFEAEIENGKDDPLSSIWKLFRNFGPEAKGQSQNKILGVKFNNNFTSNKKERADIFNTFVVNVATQSTQ